SAFRSPQSIKVGARAGRYRERLAAEDQAGVADFDQIGAEEGGAADTLAVDARAVARIEVFQRPEALFEVESRVVARDQLVFDHERVRAVAADRDAVAMKLDEVAVGAALDHRQARAGGHRARTAGVPGGRAAVVFRRQDQAEAAGEG